MAEIKEDFGEAGANISPNNQAGEPSLANVLRDGVDDNSELRTQFNALLAKLDADSGVNDTDFVATLTPAAQKNTKG